MIKINLNAARVFAMKATAQIRVGAIEDVLRHLLSARLPLMFPDNPWWIQEHSTGAEAHVHYIDAIGKKRTGFIDSLVGKTAIEYEKNLTNKAIYDEGYHQVEEYCSALLNQGVPCDDIIGVLSDTVHWHAFLVRIENEPLSSSSYGPTNIMLDEIDAVNFENYCDDNLERFGLFINRYLGRQGSRQLNSLSITMDLGFDSSFCVEHIAELRATVDEAFSSRKRYGDMIASLWQNFVEHVCMICKRSVLSGIFGFGGSDSSFCVSQTSVLPRVLVFGGSNAVFSTCQAIPVSRQRGFGRVQPILVVGDYYLCIIKPVVQIVKLRLVIDGQVIGKLETPKNKSIIQTLRLDFCRSLHGQIHIFRIGLLAGIVIKYSILL